VTRKPELRNVRSVAYDANGGWHLHQMRLDDTQGRRSVEACVRRLKPERVIPPGGPWESSAATWWECAEFVQVPGSDARNCNRPRRLARTGPAGLSGGTSGCPVPPWLGGHRMGAVYVCGTGRGPHGQRTRATGHSCSRCGASPVGTVQVF
jgi:hypothetical protein